MSLGVLHVVFWVLVAFWAVCVVLCVVLFWQEAHAFRGSRLELEVVDLDAARARRVARRRMERSA